MSRCCRVSWQPGAGQSECLEGGGGRQHGSSQLDVLVFDWQVVNGLKQRILKLEQQCKEKDTTIKYGRAGGGQGRWVLEGH